MAAFTTPVRAAGLFLYEIATLDLGTASAGRAALAVDAATAFGNPAGMTRLDRSQMFVDLQPAYGIAHLPAATAATLLDGLQDSAAISFTAQRPTSSLAFR